MSLLKCVDCGNEVDDSLSLCPHCGCPIQKKLEIDDFNFKVYKKLNYEEKNLIVKEMREKNCYNNIWEILISVCCFCMFFSSEIRNSWFFLGLAGFFVFIYFKEKQVEEYYNQHVMRK